MEYEVNSCVLTYFLTKTIHANDIVLHLFHYSQSVMSTKIIFQ